MSIHKKENERTVSIIKKGLDTIEKIETVRRNRRRTVCQSNKRGNDNIFNIGKLMDHKLKSEKTQYLLNYIIYCSLISFRCSKEKCNKKR